MLRNLVKMFFEDAAMPESAGADRTAVAVCAVLLEAAHIDDDFAEEEQDHILAVLRSSFDLGRIEAKELLEEAEQARAASTDLFRFTTALNQAFTQQEKIGIMEEVWRVLYADDVLDAHEDHLAHRLRDLLNLNQKQLIDAKMKVLEERRRQ